MLSKNDNLPPMPTSTTDDKSPAPFSGVWLGSALFTPLFGGIMAEVNFRRLGNPNKGHISLLIGVIGWIVSEIAYLVVQGIVLSSSGVASIFAPWAALLVTGVIFGAILSRRQRAEYTQWVAAHGGKQPSARRSGCLTGIAIFVVASVIAYGLYSVIQPISIRVLASIQPAVTYNDNTVSIVKPSGWYNISLSNLTGTLCTQEGSTCLLAGTHGDDLLFVVNRFTGSNFTSLSPQDVDSQVWTSLQQSTSTAKEVSSKAVKVDGRDANQRIYTYTDIVLGNRSRLLLFVKEDGGSFRAFAKSEGLN